MSEATETVAAPASCCPHNSADALSRAMRACSFPKADITALSKRLQDRAAPPPPPAAAADAAGLKVEKNALALVFIPAIMSLVEEFVARHPGMSFNMLLGELGMNPVAHIRPQLDRRNPQASLCAYTYMSLRSVFEHMARGYVAAAAAAAEAGDEQMAWVVEALLGRYQRALTEYHAHTSVSATHFTPSGHILAGINTALFFILRGLSAAVVLGERKLGRPVTRDELLAAMENTTPLLLTIARCHLELLLELEGPLGKGDDLFLARLDAAAYADALDHMFVVESGPEGLRLEINAEVLAGLPVLAGDKPRTGCPALYAATFDNVNAIVALVRLTGAAFADLWFD